MHKTQSKAGGILEIQNMYQSRGPPEGWILDLVLSHKKRAGLDDC